MPSEPKNAKSGGDTHARPFAKIDAQEMRAALRYISGGELKVWLAYRTHANAKGEAWLRLSTLAEDTGLASASASRHRNALKERGWLIPVNDGYRSKAGTFAPPRFRAVIPQNFRTDETPHGKIAARQESELPHGKIGRCRTAKLPYQVDVLEEDVSEEDQKSADALLVEKDFENPKTADPRFKQLKDAYFEEFHRRFGVPPDFDGSDGKELARFLKRRSESAEALILWLRNAFDSDDIPPTWEKFRLREWCGRAAKFSAGPLRKKDTRTRAVNLENTDPGKFSSVIA